MKKGSNPPPPNIPNKPTPPPSPPRKRSGIIEYKNVMTSRGVKMSYGNCPICGAKGIMRERRMNGNDKCENGHTYPSRDSIPIGSNLTLKTATPTWQDHPTEDGYYWLNGDCNELIIVKVYWINNKFCDTEVSCCGSVGRRLIDITGKWYGPITPPEDG